MGLFFYTKKGSIISTVDLPTTEIIEPKKEDDNIFLLFLLIKTQYQPQYQSGRSQLVKHRRQIQPQTTRHQYLYL